MTSYKDQDLPPNFKQMGVPVDIFNGNVPLELLASLFGKSSVNPITAPDLVDTTTPVGLVTGGCSFTYGDGIPRSMVWSEILARELDVDHVSFAERGWSTECAVTAVLTYLKSHAKPKYVAMMLPDLRRMHVPVNKILHRNGSIELAKNDSYFEFVPVFVSSPWFEERPTYFKAPLDLRQVLSPEMAIYQSAKAIKTLVDYCMDHKILLVWSTWDSDTNSFYTSSMQLLEIDLGNFLTTSFYDKNYEGIGLPSTCHPEEASTYGENFYIGVDENQHSGVHQHIHWAQDFYVKIKETEAR